MHQLPQSHCGDNREGTLFSWLHIYNIQIYISSSTGPAPNRYDYMWFLVRLWLTYGSRMWTGAIWRSEPAHLGNSVRTHIITSFTYRGVYYFNEPSKGTVWFFGTVWKWTNFFYIIGPFEGKFYEIFRRKYGLRQFYHIFHDDISQKGKTDPFFHYNYFRLTFLSYRYQ